MNKRIVANTDQLSVVTTTNDEGPRDRLVYLQIVQKNGGIYWDRQLTSYVNAVGQRLTQRNPASGLQHHFVLLDDSSQNLYALPGGYLVLTRGILANLTSETELAALLGHALGHLLAGHSLTEADSARVGLNLRPYSGAEEAEADRIGIDSMVKAGYAPLAALAQVGLSAQNAAAGLNPPGLNAPSPCRPLALERQRDNQRYIDAYHPSLAGGSQTEDGFGPALESLHQAEQGYATYEQARQMEHEGQDAEAIRLYHQALLEAPNEPLILMGLGLAYLRNEDLVPARRYLLKAINLQDEYYQSHLALGYVYQQKEQHAKALEQFEFGYKLFPTLEGSYLLAEAREKVGDKLGARELYEAVVTADASGKLGRNAAERLKGLDK